MNAGESQQIADLGNSVFMLRNQLLGFIELQLRNVLLRGHAQVCPEQSLQTGAGNGEFLTQILHGVAGVDVVVDEHEDLVEHRIVVMALERGFLTGGFLLSPSN